MTCCIGKARIYFREPINYWLTYQLPNGAIGSVTASEPMTTSCISQPPGQQPIQYKVWYKTRTIPRAGMAWTESQEYYDGIVTGPIGTIILYGYNYGTYYIIRHGITHANQQSWRAINYAWRLEYVLRIEAVNPAEEQPGYTFKVIGTETGTVYREIGGLEECPTVISNICLMGEERYVDVEMGSGLPLPGVPTSITNFIPDCLIAVTGFPLPPNTIEIRKITAKPLATNPFKPVKLPQKVLTLTGLPGCPAEYRIECCPDGECEPEEKCPPDTDCSLDCNGLICCYKDGKVIKSFRK